MNRALECSGINEHDSDSVQEALELCYRTSRGLGGLELIYIATGGGGGYRQQCRCPSQRDCLRGRPRDWVSAQRASRSKCEAALPLPLGLVASP